MADSGGRPRAVGDERSRITNRMEITGPAAETVGPQICPEISGDVPQVLATLAARAEGRKDTSGAWKGDVGGGATSSPLTP
jgi:hypothetical protein